MVRIQFAVCLRMSFIVVVIVVVINSSREQKYGLIQVCWLFITGKYCWSC